MIRSIILLLLLSVNYLYAQQADRFTLKNISINTKDNEFGTVLSDGGSSIYYLQSSFRSGGLNERSANLFKADLATKGEISKGRKYPTDAINAVFTKNGNTVYYSKKSGKKFQIFKAQIDRTGRWKKEEKLPFNNSQYTFKQPALNEDETKLFFVSNKEDSHGGLDIYFVAIGEGTSGYGIPTNIGSGVNSVNDELYPFLGNRDKLFFSSSNNSMGGLDVFESFFEEGSYATASSLNEPINSIADDFSFIQIPNTDTGYFSSTRTTGKGGADIYYYKDKKPTLNQCSGSISGVVRNKNTKKEIFEATVEIFSSVGHIETLLTDFKGQFSISNVECEKNYDIVTYKEGFSGIAEVKTISEEGKILSLYLNPEFPEGFEEEYDLTNEMVVIDTETNEVIVTKADELDAELSFAEKRELNRKQKEDLRRKRIEEEAEAMRIETQRIEAEKEAIVEERRQAAEKEKQERAALAQAKARKMIEERKESEGERIAQAKLRAERIREEIANAEGEEALQKAKEEVVTNQRETRESDLDRIKAYERKEAARIAQELAEQERQETLRKEASIAQAETQREAAEKERKERIAQAKAEAERIRNEGETLTVEKETSDLEKIKAQERKEAERVAEELAEQERQETLRKEASIAQVETQREAAEKARMERIAQAKAEAERIRNEGENQTVEKETSDLEIIKAQERKEAERVAEELAEQERQEALRKEESVAQAETQREAAEKARMERIAQAKAEAERIRNEGENQTVEKETSDLEKIKAQERKEAERVAEELAEQERQEVLRKEASIAQAETQREAAEKERMERISQAKAEAERIRKEGETVVIESEMSVLEKIKAQERKEEERVAQEIAEQESLVSSEKAEITQEEDIKPETPSDRCARNISGVIQDSHNGLYISGAQVDMYFDGQNIESTQSNENGEFIFVNVDCETEYTLICFKKYYNNIAKIDIASGTLENIITLRLDPDIEVIAEREKPEIVVEKPIEKTIESNEEEYPVAIEPVVEIPEVIDSKVQLNPIYFDLDEYYLTLPARRELDKIIVLMIQHPTMIIESGSHTDTRGPFDYNLELSEKRSQEAVGYLIANGVDSDRISGRGYGETIPLNHCVDGVRCSDSEHLVNRRTEFVILRN